MAFVRMTPEGAMELFDRMAKVKDWEALTGLIRKFYGDDAHHFQVTIYTEGSRSWIDALSVYNEANEIIITQPRNQGLRDHMMSLDSAYTPQGNITGARRVAWLTDMFSKIDEGEDAGDLEQAVNEAMFNLYQSFQFDSSYKLQRRLRANLADHPDPNLPELYILVDD